MTPSPILSNPSGLATGGAMGPYSNPVYNQWALNNYASQYGVNPSQVTWSPSGYSLGGVGTPAPTPAYQTPAPYATGGGVTPSPMNPIYYATPSTASSVASLLGGTTTPYNMSAPGSSISIPPAQGISVGGQTFDAGVLANLLQRGYSPQALAQQFSLQTGGAANPSASALAAYLGAPSTGSAPVPPPGTGWLPGNVGPSTQQQATQPVINNPTATQPTAPALPAASAGTTTGKTTSGGTTPSGQPQLQPQLKLQGTPLATQPGGGMASPFTGTWAPQQAGPFSMPTGGGGPTGGSPDLFLSGLAQGGMTGLNQMLASGGNPISQTPAWDAMVAAQQRGIQENIAQLNEQFGASDNRFSSSYGTALTDYMTQTSLNQNALLGQMQAQAGENAANRLLSASTTLGGYGYGAGQQLSSQDFQSQMQQYNLAAQAAQAMAGYGYGGAQNLLGNAQQAALGMYQGQTSLLPSFMQNDYLAQQLGLNTALNASTNWGQNLLTGAQLGGQQYGLEQQALTNQYNQWLYQQPQYNPFVQQAYQLGTYYPSPIMPSYTPGWFGSLLGAAGTIGGAALSDVRLKENIVPLGDIKGISFYKYNFKGDPTPRFGPMAQEVALRMPDAVIQGDATHPWLIKVNQFVDNLLGVQ